MSFDSRALTAANPQQATAYGSLMDAALQPLPAPARTSSHTSRGTHPALVQPAWDTVSLSGESSPLLRHPLHSPQPWALQPPLTSHRSLWPQELKATQRWPLSRDWALLSAGGFSDDLQRNSPQHCRLSKGLCPPTLKSCRLRGCVWAPVSSQGSVTGCGQAPLSELGSSRGCGQALPTTMSTLRGRVRLPSAPGAPLSAGGSLKGRARSP